MPDLSYLPQIALSGIAVGCIYGLIGIGFCVIYNASGIVNFAQGAFVMLGGMIAYSAFHTLGLPLFAAAVIATVVVAAMGVVIERVVVRPLWDRKATMFVMILATLAAQIVIERMTLIVAGDQPKTLPQFSDLPPLRLGGIVVSYQFLWIVGISLLLIGLLEPVLQADQDRQGHARLRLQPRGGGAAGHQRVEDAGAFVRAVRGAWRDRRRADYSDAIHRLQCRRAVCDLRLYRSHRRRFRPPARCVHGWHHARARAIDCDRRVRRGPQERGGAFGAADLPFHSTGGHSRRSKVTEDIMDLHKIDWEQIPWEPVREGIVRKAFSGNGATLALHKLMPKHEPKPHKHTYEQIVYILAGHIRFHVGDKSVVLGPGGLLQIPPDVMHWGEVVGDEPVLNLDIFTPVREEYAPAP